MKRRTVVGAVSFLGGCVTPVALTACGGSGSSASVPPSTGRVVGTFSQLQQQGQLLSTANGQPSVLVIPDPAQPRSVLAVGANCTHQGCFIAWNATQSRFQCPCHGSAFSAQGQVINGPAGLPLPTYTASLQGESIVVQV